MRVILINSLFIVSIALFVSGCTKESSYYILHDIAKQECRGVLNHDDRRACEASHDKSYKEFEIEKNMKKEF